MEELDALALTHLGELKLCSLETAVASLGRVATCEGNQLGNAIAANFTLGEGQDIDETQSHARVDLAPRVPACKSSSDVQHSVYSCEKA